MIPRDGVSRRQVPQLREALEKGMPVPEICKNFVIMPAVVFSFARAWNIELKDTPESLELKRHEALIEDEVRRRVEEVLDKKTIQPPVPEVATSVFGANTEDNS